MKFEVSPVTSDVIKHAYIVKPPWKPKRTGSESFWVGKHQEVGRGLCTLERHGSLVLLPSHLALFISFIWLFLRCILCNKLGIQKVHCFPCFSESVQQITQPQEGVMGTSHLHLVIQKLRRQSGFAIGMRSGAAVLTCGI